jgi:SAM-dependent methyltransferase
MNDELKNKAMRYWDLRPCNIKHSNKEIGSLEYFEEVEKRRYTVEPHIPDFAKFEETNGMNVLEIGCGIGTDTIQFAKAGAKIVALDISKVSVDICKKRFQVYGLEGEIMCADAEDVDKIFADRKFDIIYSFGVIHHTMNPSNIIEKLRSVCHEGTVIRMMFYSKYSFKGLDFYLRHGWRFGFNYKKTIRYYAEAQLGCPIADVYSKSDLLKMFNKYEVVRLVKDHIFPYKIEDYKNGRLRKRFIFRVMSPSFYKWLCTIIGWHYLIELKIK